MVIKIKLTEQQVEAALRDFVLTAIKRQQRKS